MKNINILDRLYQYQKDAVSTTLTSNRGIICLPTGCGKCLAKGTLVMMYNGTFKKVEDIVVGDIIMGDDSTPRTILSLARGTEMMYDIIPTKGEKYTVNESHILSLKVTNIGNDRLTVMGNKYKTGDIVDVSVKDYLTLSKTAKHVLKGFRVGVEFENQNKSLPISPRLLGLWLADGTASQPSFTVNDNDIETIEYLKKECESMGLEFTIENNSENSKTYFFRTKFRGKANAKTNIFLNLLRDNNLLNNKHIPHEYKTASKEDRLELLAGVLDGDAYLFNNCFDLTLVSETLFDDVIFLTRSLGLACYKKPVRKGIKSLNFVGNYFRMSISGNTNEIPTIVERKKSTIRSQKKDVLVTGIEVKPIGNGEYFGFEIDGNRRFLLSDFTVTHNTFTQSAIIADDIIRGNGFQMYVVNAPRIVLTYQLLKEVYGFLVDAGIEARYMFVHSGGKVNEKELEDIRIKANLDGANIPFSEIASGTNLDEIRGMMFKAEEQNLPLIFFSTYNSAERIEQARYGFDELSIVLNDESHYLVQEQFHDILSVLKSKRCYFFTATTISTPSDKGRGMNNKELYGEVLYHMIPRQAIDMGKMVRPRLHFVITDGVYTTEDYNNSLNKIIKDTFEQHSKIITKVSPKVLVSSKGTQDMVSFLNSREYRELRRDGVDIYAVASNDDIGNNINGEQVKRQEFLQRLKKDGENPNKKLIVLHYDILAEGIDVSGFSGIMPLRTLSKSKFLQTYGRAARPDGIDRKRIDNKEISVNDLELMNKPYAYIMIPSVYNGNEDDRENVVQLITELRDYGFNPNEDIVGNDQIHGVPEIEQPDGLNELRRNLPNVGQTIERLEAEIEAEQDAKLNKTNLLKDKFGF
jgi:superfamily II DNA or RNA helicase